MVIDTLCSGMTSNINDKALACYNGTVKVREHPNEI